MTKPAGATPRVQTGCCTTPTAGRAAAPTPTTSTPHLVCANAVGRPHAHGRAQHTCTHTRTPGMRTHPACTCGCADDWECAAGSFLAHGASSLDECSSVRISSPIQSPRQPASSYLILSFLSYLSYLIFLILSCDPVLSDPILSYLILPCLI